MLFSPEQDVKQTLAKMNQYSPHCQKGSVHCELHLTFLIISLSPHPPPLLVAFEVSLDKFN